jgi:6-phosphogluconolactonase
MIEMFPSAAVAAEAAAAAVARCLVDGLKTRGRASLVATGGRSPGPVYDRLRDAAVDWTRVVVTLSDERRVEPTSADSNTRLVRERLLVGRAAKAHLLPLADDAEPGLRALLPFDAVLLGMGEDGHVASLIPGSPALAQGMDLDSDRLLIDIPAGVGSPPLARVSLTLPAILQAKAIFLLIAGDAKREVIARAEAGADMPVGAILAQDRVPVRVLWAPNHKD